MARNKELLLNRMLRRGEDAGLLVSAVALMLVEAGYVAWLERLPALPSPAHPARFVDLPHGYKRPTVELTLVLTILGGIIASTVSLMRDRSDGTVASTNRALVTATEDGPHSTQSWLAPTCSSYSSFVRKFSTSENNMDNWHLVTGGQHTRRYLKLRLFIAIVPVNRLPRLLALLTKVYHFSNDQAAELATTSSAG
jgi:hypothetical protein